MRFADHCTVFMYFTQRPKFLGIGVVFKVLYKLLV